MNGAAQGMFAELGSALHFLESFEILVTSGLLRSPQLSDNLPRS